MHRYSSWKQLDSRIIAGCTPLIGQLNIIILNYVSTLNAPYNRGHIVGGGHVSAQIPRQTIEVSAEQLESHPDGKFDATWESVESNYSVPQWFKDAKFGIFIHWGPYTVPAAGSEWYPKHMYNGLSKAHREKWGKQTEFGYKDFIPLFTAEKFDADQWAELFKASGAQYVIPTAEHHDGFAMYDSRLTDWNSVNHGPYRDVIG